MRSLLKCRRRPHGHDVSCFIEFRQETKKIRFFKVCNGLKVLKQLKIKQAVPFRNRSKLGFEFSLNPRNDTSIGLRHEEEGGEARQRAPTAANSHSDRRRNRGMNG